MTMRVSILTLLLFATTLTAAAGLRAAPAPSVGFEQRLGETLPLTATFRDTTGRTGPLSTWFRDGRPVVLWFGYARCPQLCSVVADGLVAALRPLEASAGKEFDVVMISIDPAETPDEASERRTRSLKRYGRTDSGAGWYYLTGDEAGIRATTGAAGFHFTYDERSRQYSHASGFLVLTPKGQISAYFPGVDFAPKEVAAAIGRAGRNGIGQKVADLLLVCFRGGAIGGRYGPLIWRTLEAAVALTVVALGTGIGWMLWCEKKALRAQQEGDAT